MSLDIILYILLAVLMLYIIVLPLSKKRPVVIRGKIGFTAAIILIASIPYIDFWSYILAFTIGLVLYAMPTWLIFGVTTNKLRDAIQRSANMTRTDLKEDGRGYTIDHNSSIKITNLTKQSSIMLFNIRKDSKKSKLTKKVFKKFIENYKIGE